MRIPLLICLLVFSCNMPSKKQHGAVVSARKEASEIGVEIMRRGGNAFDAMIATDLALAVCYPNAGNIGGGGFMVYRTKLGDVGTIDFREKAPSLANASMFLDSLGNVQKSKSTRGGLSIGVPGTVAGLFEIHEKFGSMPFEELIQPAIDLAKNGFTVTAKQEISLSANRSEIIAENGPESFYADNYKEGQVIYNLKMAEALKKIKLNGKDGFYKGEIAREIIKSVQSSGGIMLLKDLENYAPVWRDPIKFQYKNLDIYSMGPPSSGGICLAQMMAMVSEFDIGQYPALSLQAVQLMVESERRSFADRAEYLGDPDFTKIPVSNLINREYLKNKMSSFSFSEATPSEKVKPGNNFTKESEETTHYSIIDPYGNAVSVTTTLNGNYGSKVFVEEFGFFLNNQMDDFSIKLGEPNMYGLIGGEANKISANKRMLSSMTPTIVEENGALALILGSPGGSTIITSVFQVILNVFEFDMTVNEAVNAPRFHHQWLPDQIDFEKNAFNADFIKNLQKKGYFFDQDKYRKIGRVDAIRILPGNKIVPAADPRGDDAAVLLQQ